MSIRLKVSIHAPVWGATRSILCFLTHCPFQSTRPYGARPKWGDKGATVLKFQSTRPYGARRGGLQSSSSTGSFNPRARMGRDLRMAFTRFIAAFQSTRPYGARRAVGIHFNAEEVFQSTRPYGARSPGGRGHPDAGRFNPRARMGRDLSHPGIPAT